MVKLACVKFGQKCEIWPKMWRLPVDGKNFTNWILMVFLFGREILYHVGHLVSHLVNLHVHHHVGHLVNLHVHQP